MPEGSAIPSDSWRRVLPCSNCSEWSSPIDSQSNCAVDDHSSSCTPSTWPAGVEWLDHGPDDGPQSNSGREPPFSPGNQLSSTKSKAKLGCSGSCLGVLSGP